MKYKFPLHVKRVDLPINESFSVKTGLHAFAKSIDSGQPARNAQTDLGRNFLLLANFMHIKGLYNRFA